MSRSDEIIRIVSDYKKIEVMIEYEKRIVKTLEELTPFWWI